MAATVASLSSSLLFSKPSLTLRPFRILPRIITSSLPSSSSSPPQFNISFAPPKPKPKPSEPDPFSDSDPESGGQLIIPWIVRGEDGNLKLQMHPPARLLHATANSDTATTTTTTTAKKNKINENKSSEVVPKSNYSKAARRFYNDNFKDPPQRLSKVLAAAGVASRRSSEELIFGGKVTVNGSVCNTPQDAIRWGYEDTHAGVSRHPVLECPCFLVTRVDPAKDIIYVNGNRLPKKQPPKIYLALNKPKGYICSSGDKESKSVLSLFDDYLKTLDKRHSGVPKPRLFTVGRLDVATTGLIIVTNDGDFAQQISHPSANLSKEYIAIIDGDVNKRHLIAISDGTVIEGVHCTPDSVELLPRQPDIPRPRLRIVVHEGRKHEVRELVKNAGLEIHSLKRVRIGGFRLPSDLGIGKHIELKQSHLKALDWKS